jgi:hypothetical protein
MRRVSLARSMAWSKDEKCWTTSAQKHVAIPPRPSLQLIDRAVRALAGAVRIAMRDEACVEDGLDDIAQRMMHDAVAKRGGADLAPLRFVDEEVAIRAGPIRLHAQFALQRNQPVGELVIERRCAARSALATRDQAIGPPQVVLPGDRVEHGTHLTLRAA